MAAETIIESFCERCGTRYTFEPVRKRESKLVGIGKTLGILLDSPGSGSATRDPFHGTFHFCLECRQYTCPSCWNELAGFCLGCVPLPEAPDRAALDAAEAEATLEAASFMDEALAEHNALATADAWPDADLHRRLEAAEHTDVGPDHAVLAAAAVAAVVAEPEIAEDDSWSLTFEPHDADEPEAQVEMLADDAVLEAVTLAAVALSPDADPFDAERPADLALDEIPLDAEPAEAITESMTDADPGHDAVASLTFAADDSAAEANAATVAVAEMPSEVEPAVVRAAVPPEDDAEADWADLFRRPPAGMDDEIAADDWSAMAPALGPDIAQADAIVAPPAPVNVPPTPTIAPVASWQLTAPASELEPRPTAWPPLGPVFRPTPAAPAPNVPHPSVLVPRPANARALSRSQGQAAAPAPLPKGVRPCVNCELPLSATARFCRRCGRPQG